MLALMWIVLAVPTPAAAYVGPGAGLTAIGIVIALLATVVLALIGFVWYPIRRMMSRRGKAEEDTATPSDAK